MTAVCLVVNITSPAGLGDDDEERGARDGFWCKSYSQDLTRLRAQSSLAAIRPPSHLSIVTALFMWTITIIGQIVRSFVRSFDRSTPPTLLTAICLSVHPFIRFSQYPSDETYAATSYDLVSPRSSSSSSFCRLHANARRSRSYCTAHDPRHTTS
ncbi:unnamed protein product [Soboliphyme baturini]|uniref:Secreted protein n=1 Tax=Soboliphyme baturini TaxID=241478 RepID=A0A183ISL8_9BILA|nr:unnamed protein product [Soboliphyme baturini]